VSPESDTACLVLLREMPDKLVITVANPENKRATVCVEVRGKSRGEGVEAPDRPIRAHTAFELPGGMEAGRSVTRAFPRP